MKATINGVTVEGTPQEIAEYARLVGEAKETPIATLPYQPMPSVIPDQPWRTRPWWTGDVTWKSGNVTMCGVRNAVAAPCPMAPYTTLN